MNKTEQSIRTQQRKLEAYGVARPRVEAFKDDPWVLQSFVEVAFELLHERGRYYEIAQLLQDGLNYVALGMQKFEVKAVEESGRQQAPDVVVAWSDGPRTAECGECGRPGIELDEGPELFLAGSDAPICHRCAQAHAPGLVGLMALFKKNKAFVSALREMRKTPPRRKVTDDFDAF